MFILKKLLTCLNNKRGTKRKENHIWISTFFIAYNKQGMNYKKRTVMILLNTKSLGIKTNKLNSIHTELYNILNNEKNLVCLIH